MIAFKRKRTVEKKVRENHFLTMFKKWYCEI